jgi:hypothetical protein
MRYCPLFLILCDVWDIRHFGTRQSGHRHATTAQLSVIMLNVVLRNVAVPKDGWGMLLSFNQKQKQNSSRKVFDAANF